MQLKITRSGSRRYLQLVQAYRDPDSGRPKQRHLASLGRLDRIADGDLDNLINGLLRLTGRSLLDGEEAQQAKSVPARQADPRAEPGLAPVRRALEALGCLKPEGAGTAGGGEEALCIAVTGAVRTHGWRGLDAFPDESATDSTVRETARRAVAAMHAAAGPGAEGDSPLTLHLLPWPPGHTSFPPVAAPGAKHPYGLAVLRPVAGPPVAAIPLTTHRGLAASVAEARKDLPRWCHERPFVVVAGSEWTLEIDLSSGTPHRLFNDSKSSYIFEIGSSQLTADKCFRGILDLSECSGRSRLETHGHVDMNAGADRVVMAFSSDRALSRRRHRARRLVRGLRLAAQLTTRLDAQDRGRVSPSGPLTDAQAAATLQGALYDLGIARFLRAALDEDGFFTWFWLVDELCLALRLDGCTALLTNLDQPGEAIIASFELHTRTGEAVTRLLGGAAYTALDGDLATLALAVDHYLRTKSDADSRGT